MTTLKYVVGVLVLVILGGVVGHYLFAGSSQSYGAASPSGSTNTNGIIASENLVTSTDTVFSMLNSGNDKTIVNFEMQAANGSATTSQYAIYCGTSTTASGVGASTSRIVDAIVSAAGANVAQAFGTTTGAGLFVSTSSPGVTGTSSTASIFGANVNPFARQWPSGTYLTCKTVNTTANSNAANTLDSLTTGFVDFVLRSQ